MIIDADRVIRLDDGEQIPLGRSRTVFYDARMADEDPNDPQTFRLVAGDNRSGRGSPASSSHRQPSKHI